MNLFYSRQIAPALAAFWLCGCSPEKVAHKILPEDIQQESVGLVDAIMEGNTAYFVPRKADLSPPAQLSSVSDDMFETFISRALSMKQSQTEVSRHLVGVKASVKASPGGGTARIFETVYEVETLDGFVLIAIRLAYRAETKDCCEIKSIDARDFETSPFRAAQSVRRKILAILGGLVAAVIGSLGLIFLRRRRRETPHMN